MSMLAWSVFLVALLAAAHTAALPSHHSFLVQQHPVSVPVLHVQRTPKQHHWGTTLMVDVVRHTCTQLEHVGPAQRHRGLSNAAPTAVVSRPAKRSSDHRPITAQTDETELSMHWVSIVGLMPDDVRNTVRSMCPHGVEEPTDPSTMTTESNPDMSSRDKIFKIISNGSPDNRIDVVFMGDGYTVDEAAVFESDIRRLVKEMWTGSTFASLLPLFNVWAIFRPSREHGIGVAGRPKDTAFGLYRDGTELRGIYTSKPNEARRACRQLGQYACDYPSLIGNDPFYGGLGGEFVISTSSRTTGTVVLRHEMGHNFIAVGEEYDGGYVYDGCNAAKSLDDVPWRAWLTDQDQVREERAALRIEDYAWYDLAKGPYTINFTSDGKFDRWLLKISASGVESEGSLLVYLDDKPLGWNTTGTLDRSFTEWRNDGGGFSAANHTLRFEQAFPPSGPNAPIRQICSITLHEFADESEFRMDNSIVSMYPTWSLGGIKTYRPTNEGCIMRNMSSTSFCPICREGLWENLLLRVSLIDDLIESCDAMDDGTSKHFLELIPVPLAQFRPIRDRIDGERYKVTWRRDGEILDQYNDSFAIEIPSNDMSDRGSIGAHGSIYSVELVFETPEVRTDKHDVLRTTADWVAKRSYGFGSHLADSKQLHTKKMVGSRGKPKRRRRRSASATAGMDDDTAANLSRNPAPHKTSDMFLFKPSHQLSDDENHQLELKKRDLDYFRIFFAPAAGPRAFVSAGFEKRLKRLLAHDKLTTSKWLVGGSTGALRFTAFVSSLLSRRNLTWELKEHYVKMYYKKGDTAAVLRPMMEEMYKICAPKDLISQVLAHPRFHLAILVANISPAFQTLPDIALRAAFAGFYIGNMLNPSFLAAFCKRICFYTGPEPPVFLDHGLGGSDGIQYVPLTVDNVHHVLHATTCVPFVQEQCNYIPGIGRGRFFDGAMTDYYLNVQLKDERMPALLLADSIGCRVYPTAFDSLLPWTRLPSQEMYTHCSAIYPSDSYIHTLPERKLPSMGDWFNDEYIREPDRRHQNWHTCFELSEKYWHSAIVRAKSTRCYVKSIASVVVISEPFPPAQTTR